MTDPVATQQDDEALVGLAARLADGDMVDWESEEIRTPDLGAEIRGLRWMEQIAQAGRTGEDTASMESGAAGQVSAVEPRPEPISFAPGTTWGPLTILEKIGAGGAGDVFRAHDPSLEREVALKLWRETATRKTTGTEARRLAKVRHPGILAVHGTGRYDGYAGMWTDMVLGKNLEELLQEEGPFAVNEAVRIGVALCDALGAMHRAGLVHRDVKTSNVMREADGRVILMDFGSVKELLRGVPEHTGRMRGTPLTMAPEVLRGDRVGPAADVYGLGVLLYRLLTVRYPIEAATVAELIDAHGEGRTVPLREGRPDVPANLAALIQRALATTPVERFENFDAFRQSLEASGVVQAPSRWSLFTRIRKAFSRRA